MNILYISSKKRWGGVVSWMAITARGLKKRGHRVWILSHPNSMLNKHLDTGTDLISKKLGPVYNPFMVSFLTNFIKKNGIDLIVTNIDKEVGIGGLAARICRIPNIRRIGRDDDFNNTFRMKWGHILLVDKCIVPCDYIKDKVANLYPWVNPSRFQTIYNGRNPQSFSAKEIARQRAEWRIKENEKVIGITSQLTKIKYVVNLVRAFSMLPGNNDNIKLVITGEGPEKNDLIELSKELNMESRIVFSGFSSNPVFTASCYDIALSVSKNEGFPNSIVEYFAAGKAVISTNVGGVPEIITDNENGFLVPFGDIGVLSEKIDILLKDDDLRTRFGNNGLQIIKKRFTEDMMIENLEQYYYRVIQ